MINCKDCQWFERENLFCQLLEDAAYENEGCTIGCPFEDEADYEDHNDYKGMGWVGKDGQP